VSQSEIASKGFLSVLQSLAHFRKKINAKFLLHLQNLKLMWQTLLHKKTTLVINLKISILNNELLCYDAYEQYDNFCKPLLSSC